MHKKSLEAADTLKSSDENSDKEEETRTEASDLSGTSINDKRRSMTPTITTNHMKKPTSNGTPLSPSQSIKSSSISPSTMSPPITNLTSATPTSHHHPLGSDKQSSKDYSLLASPISSRNNGGSNYLHLNPHEQPRLPPPIAHLNQHHPMSHTDDPHNPEVFRWVNYNQNYRESYIR